MGQILIHLKIRQILTKKLHCTLLFGMLCILTSLVLFSGCTDQFSSADSLTILVDDTDELEGIREVAHSYQNATGTSVIVQEVPAGWSPGSGKNLTGDLLLADMGRIPVFAGDGQIRPLNDDLSTGTLVNWTVFERPSLILAGEYPDRSGTMYAFPFSQDTQGIAFRTDLLYNPDESDAFCLTYGLPLAVPGTYDELQMMAAFFTRNESGVYGIGFSGLSGSDPGSSPWLSIVSSYGSSVLGRTGQASGTWNSTATVHALMMLQNLSTYEPVGSHTWDNTDVRDALVSGKIAMAITWFSQFPMIEQAAIAQNISIGYMPLPGQIRDDGSHRGIAVRITGIGLLSDGSIDKGQAFLNWYFSPEVQFERAESGYQPSVLPVLDSYPYLSLSLYNRAFPESVRVGVTDVKGHDMDEIRSLIHEQIKEILDQNLSPAQIRSALDSSALSIDQISRHT
jgi:ABC-type glycerol-3-phosphate transport system substrate-binding protein